MGTSTTRGYESNHVHTLIGQLIQVKLPGSEDVTVIKEGQKRAVQKIKGRGDLVVNALNYINENPISGNGVDFAVQKHVHNTYVGIWVDAGIITLLFFLFMLGYLFIQTLSLRPEIRYFGIPILIGIFW